MTKTAITQIRPAGPRDRVLTVEGGQGSYRKRPCQGCPWVKENDRAFSARAFTHSAGTAYDMSRRQFGCHESGHNKPAICAGFLLRGSTHNLSARLDLMTGRVDIDQVSDGGRELHENYLSMAVANGVPPDAPELMKCR